MLKILQPVFLLLGLLLITQTGCTQKRDFSYMGELPEQKFQVLQINADGMDMIDADSIPQISS